MVERIKDLKDEMLMQAEQDMHEQGRVDPMVIDNIKDLAEAEKYCMESDKLGAAEDLTSERQRDHIPPRKRSS